MWFLTIGYMTSPLNGAPVARNVSRRGRNETATLATPLYDRGFSGIENNSMSLLFFKDQ
jgi:hypothetical protein